MFISCYSNVIDPKTFDPVLIVFVNERRHAIREMKLHATFTVRGSQKRNWYGIPMWVLSLDVKEGTDALWERFPKKMIMNHPDQS